MDSHFDRKTEVKTIRKTISLVVVTILLPISLYTLCSSTVFPKAFAYESIKMTEQKSFVDSSGNLNVIGVVDNLGRMPVGVTVGLKTTTASVDASKSATTTSTLIKQPIYGKVIYPFTGAPFKFIITPRQTVIDKAFIVDVKQFLVPNWNVLSLNYSNMPAGKDAALVGTAKNVGPFDLHDVSIYASAHSRNGTQVDSVKSNLIPLIKPGQQISFSAKPEAVVKSGVYYFSCAGFDLNAPITTLDIGKGQFIPYDLRALARISDFKYDNTTDSITFGVSYYSDNGGPLTLKIPQTSEKQSVSVLMDGATYKQASVKMNGKTVSIDFFVPPEDHQIQIKGVKAPEPLNTH